MIQNVIDNPEIFPLPALSTVKPPIPGGEYTAVENPDGSFNILDLEGFCEHQPPGTTDPNKYCGKDWMVAAKERLRVRWEQSYYVPPLHCYHQPLSPIADNRTKRAGFYKIRDIRRGVVDGEPKWIMYFDLVAVPRT